MSLESRPKKGQENRKKPQLDWRFRVYYTAVDGKRKQKNSKWFPERLLAETAETRFRTSIIDQPSATIPFEQVAEDWIKFSEQSNVNKIIREKKYFVNHFYLPHFGGKAIGDIKPMHIKNWLQSDLLKSNEKNFKNNRKKIVIYSTAYKNKVFTYLNSIFEHACTFYELPTNPCKRLKKFKKDISERKEMVIYSVEQLQQFIKAIPEEKIDFRAFFYILFYTGLRKNECRSLRFEDIKGDTLHIYHQLDEDNERFVKLKTESSVRTVQLDKATLEELMKLKEYYKTFEGFTDQWFVFGGTKTLSRKTLENIKNNAISATGLPYLTIHDFRHSHASYLINHGANIVAVSKRLGHSNVSMTLDTYTHLMKDSQDELITIINEINKKA